jgi:membrane-associated phospholipid phosphatase
MGFRTRDGRFRCLAAACAVAFLVLTLIAATGRLRAFDRRAVEIVAFESPCAVVVAGTATSPLLSGELSAVYAGLIALLCVVGRRPALGAAVLVGLAATVAVELACKHIVQQPEPTAVFGERDRLDCLETAYPFRAVETPGSFPSGYAARAAYFVALLGALATIRWPRRTVPIAAVSLVAAAVLGATRVAAAWHWPSDVVGGFLLGVTAACVVVAFHPLAPRAEYRRGSAPPVSPRR